jgi:O-antigen ligase
MRFVVFLIAALIALYKGLLREPIWAAVTACYFYFAIPIREFHAPDLPYQAAFWALAIITCWRYRTLGPKWAQDDIERTAMRVGHEAVDAVRGNLRETIFTEAITGTPTRELATAGVSAVEPEAFHVIAETAPKPIAPFVKQAVHSRIQAAALDAEVEAGEVLELAGRSAKGNLRVALERRAGVLLDKALDREPVAGAIHNEIDRGIKEFDQQHAQLRKLHELGPLGYPLNRGPLAGILTNAGLWAQMVFIGLTFIGAQHAKYEYWPAMMRFENAYLLLLPMIAIICGVRTARHFKLFTWAWMLGVLHLSYNGITLWISYGGRADMIGGQGGEANFLGCIATFVAPIAFSMFVAERNRIIRLAGLGMAGAYFLGILACGSRGALMAVIGAMGYWMIHTSRKGIAAGVVALAAASFIAVAPESFWDRMGTIFAPKDTNPWIQAEVELSKKERLILWDLAIEVFKDNPWMGIGPQQYVYESAERTLIRDAYQSRRGMMTHNSWLQIAAEYGGVGLFVWGGAFAMSIFYYRRARLKMAKRPGWEWFGAYCLGLEAGSLGCGVAITFASFQWHDYLYWHFIYGPLVFQIAQDTAEQLDWHLPSELAMKRPPPRYGPPRQVGKVDVEAIDIHLTPIVDQPERAGA